MSSNDSKGLSQKKLPQVKILEYVKKNLLKFNSKEIHNPIKTWAGTLNRQFFKEYEQIADKHIKDAQHNEPWGECNQNHSEILLHTY